MRLLIFGATGGTGRELVRQALDQGHAVTAFARDPAVLNARGDLRAVAGDVLDAAAVERAVAGHDAVLCARTVSSATSSSSAARARGGDSPSATAMSAARHAAARTLPIGGRPPTRMP